MVVLVSLQIIHCDVQFKDRAIMHDLKVTRLRWLRKMNVSYNDLLNPLKPELNPICYLLALLGAHHFLHVSRIRVKSLTLR